jgi:hypothetical protein
VVSELRVTVEKLGAENAGLRRQWGQNSRNSSKPPASDSTLALDKPDERLRHVSCCLRTLAGAKQFCAIRSYLPTAAKNGRNFFDTLVMLAEGRPWLPAHQ